MSVDINRVLEESKIRAERLKLIGKILRKVEKDVWTTFPSGQRNKPKLKAEFRDNQLRIEFLRDMIPFVMGRYQRMETAVIQRLNGEVKIKRYEEYGYDGYTSPLNQYEFNKICEVAFIEAEKLN